MRSVEDRDRVHPRKQPDLMLKAAEELAACMNGVAVGSPLPIDSSSELSATLEYLVPQLLAQSYPEWRGESLDGFYFSSAARSEEDSALLTGLCILMSDQTLTPFTFNLGLSDEAKLERVRIRLGEPGGGQLGISLWKWGSTDVLKNVWALNARLETIDWVYDIEIKA
jgi:hypothetical protein